MTRRRARRLKRARAAVAKQPATDAPAVGAPDTSMLWTNPTDSTISPVFRNRRAPAWMKGELKPLPESFAEEARAQGLVPVAEVPKPKQPTRPDKYGRFTHNTGRRLTNDVEIGDLRVKFWPPGAVKLLPMRLRRKAEDAGFEFLGVVAE